MKISLKKLREKNLPSDIVLNHIIEFYNLKDNDKDIYLSFTDIVNALGISNIELAIIRLRNFEFEEKEIHLLSLDASRSVEYLSDITKTINDNTQQYIDAGIINDELINNKINNTDITDIICGLHLDSNIKNDIKLRNMGWSISTAIQLYMTLVNNKKYLNYDNNLLLMINTITSSCDIVAKDNNTNTDIYKIELNKYIKKIENLYIKGL